MVQWTLEPCNLLVPMLKILKVNTLSSSHACMRTLIHYLVAGQTYTMTTWLCGVKSHFLRTQIRKFILTKGRKYFCNSFLWSGGIGGKYWRVRRKEVSKPLPVVIFFWNALSLNILMKLVLLCSLFLLKFEHWYDCGQSGLLLSVNKLALACLVHHMPLDFHLRCLCHPEWSIWMHLLILVEILHWDVPVVIALQHRSAVALQPPFSIEKILVQLKLGLSRWENTSQVGHLVLYVC